jgi:hypothetical protein
MRLRVHARPDGTLLPHHRQGAQQPIDESWWDDVLLDPRVYTPVNETRFDEDGPYARLRVDRQHGETFTCGCGFGRVIDKAELIAGVADANVLWVARRVIVDCERRTKA